MMILRMLFWRLTNILQLTKINLRKIMSGQIDFEKMSIALVDLKHIIDQMRLQQDILKSQIEAQSKATDIAIEYAEQTSLMKIEEIKRKTLQIERESVDLAEIKRAKQNEIDRALRNKQYARNDARQILNSFRIINKDNEEFQDVILAVNIYFNPASLTLGKL